MTLQMEKTRRNILKMMSSGTIASTGLSTSAAALETEKLESDKERKAIEEVVSSVQYSEIKQELNSRDAIKISDSNSRAIKTKKDGEEKILTSFKPDCIDPQKKKGRTIVSADMAFLLNSDLSVIKSKGSIRYEPDDSNVLTEVEALSYEDREVTTESKKIDKTDKEAQNLSPSSVATQYCNPCKVLYGAACDIGCDYGLSALCTYVSVAVGSSICAAIAGEVCDYVSDNSCGEDETPRAVCQIIGYCPQ
ncbi:hypothetical protein Harman_38800 [Haloarcula mannanilytica]|uniref:Halocin C8-like bacteriocin domain-containing protein n=1 Tax=Haloarcula mannanilytica TaxID=2509225 RepID=A0A4C2ENS6_9EURY|nr:halocin C8-like domain-containing protein [Haloarcula mannanilytica]GCF15945.1 hypothetical protein Harman_38800 [Haloarcula mannanilytica]